eukprot:COSAG01_NODE_18838_length_1049_cov_2.481053_1_plen_304_part_01
MVCGAACWRAWPRAPPPRTTADDCVPTAVPVLHRSYTAMLGTSTRLFSRACPWPRASAAVSAAASYRRHAAASCRRHAAATATAASAAAAAATTAVAVAAAAEGSTTATPVWPEDSRERWAYPSPYHAPDDAGHAGASAFVAGVQERFISSRPRWRLKALVEEWQRLEGEETWPWVWCQHNPNGPHHVFIGADADLLKHAQSLMRANARNNLTIVVRDEAYLRRYAPLHECANANTNGCACSASFSYAGALVMICRTCMNIVFFGWCCRYFQAGCAVIEGSVAQFDAEDRVLMLEDDRIICFDK